jgi:hypothetical protein
MRLTCAIAVVSGLALFPLARFSPAAAPASPGTAERLVRAALEAEIQNNPAERARLLTEALVLDPDFAPARWHSGFVRIGGEWIEIGEVPKRTAGDGVLAAYRKKRDALVDTADNHRELARWCRKHNLPEEQRVHWAHVLEFNPQDAEALAALGLELYQGRLMTRAQIEREKKAAGERLRATQAWQPKLLKWRRAIETGVRAKVDEARAELAKISDPAAIPALETVFGLNGSGEKIIAVNRALIETLGRMRDPAATEVLLRRAVLGEPEQVRDLAIEELKKRPMHAYVPQLIAALPGAVESKFHVYVVPSGMVVHEHEIFLKGREGNISLRLESAVSPADAVQSLTVTPQALARSALSAAAIERSVQSTEQQLAARRDRLQNVLSRTTGFANVSDPDLWQQQYNDYNGWLPPEQKPTYVYTVRSIESSAATPGIDSTTTLGHTGPQIPRGARLSSCFPAGTVVWTIQGAVPIEAVKIGDRVLSQDTATGELAYKPVHATTQRPSIALRKIDLGTTSLHATQGHPFWVISDGWRLARNLRPGDRLYALDGALEVKEVETSQSLPAHNLVVSEFHTYFVGAEKLLVHDNVAPSEDPGALPGMVSIR